MTSAGVLYDYRLPEAATVPAVARFYLRRLTAMGWRLQERLPGLPHHRAGPTLNFRDGRYSLSVNLDGVFHGCQAVLPTLISQRGGRIINIASLSALLAPAGQTNYAAAKAGVIALTQSLAKEMARIGITVNVVCPGYVETEALSGLSEEERKGALSKIPMRRFGRPEEVAVAVRFLACAEASYITGSVLKVDGGIL